MMFVRNVGVEDIKLVAIYVDDISCSGASTCLLVSGGGLCTTLPYTIGVGQVCEFNVTWTSGWSSGSIFNLIATSARGNRATFTIRSP